MTETQKIIKYIAIGFGFFLIISIFSSVFMFFNFFDTDSTDRQITTLFKTNDNILELDINVGTADLVINDGEHLTVETNNKYVTCKQVGKKLEIKEKKHNVINNKNNKLIITLPSNIELDVFEISSGAGKIEVDRISSKKADIELGAGKVDFNNLNISSNAKIEGGAGQITIKNGYINNLDLDMGVGKTTINSKLLGNIDIDAGVGELNINLLDSINSYFIIVDKGIGSIKLNGDSISNTIGSGSNKIDIDGGVGSINITTIER